MVQVTVMKTLMEREKWLAHSSTSYTGPGYSTWAGCRVQTEICTIFRKGAFYRLLQ